MAKGLVIGMPIWISSAAVRASMSCAPSAAIVALVAADLEDDGTRSPVPYLLLPLLAALALTLLATCGASDDEAEAETEAGVEAEAGIGVGGVWDG